MNASTLWSRWRGGEASALILGAGMPFAFAPFNLYPLAILCPALLFALWRGVSPGRAFMRGYLFGLGMFSIGISWVFVSMYNYGEMGWLLSGLITALLAGACALFPALAGYTAVRLSARAPLGTLAWVLIFPSVWTLFEWVRGWFLTGFPWLNIGYSQIDAPLAGFAPLIGVYGVSLAAALSAALLLAVFGDGGRLRGAWLGAFAGLWLAGGVLGMADWTRSAGEPLRISLVQGNIPQDLKWHPGMRDLTVDLYTELSRANWDSDLIVWPETAIPMFDFEARDLLEALDREARDNGSELLVGIVSTDRERRRYYNSMLTAGGEQTQVYHKHHLVPFTEYLPMQSVLGRFVDMMSIPMSDFSAGEAGQPPLELAGQKAGVSVCYDVAFGEEIIRKLPEATFLVNVSNDAWFGDSLAPPQHLQIARMRALEAGRHMARGTNTGISAFIGPRGEVRSMAPQFVAHVLTEEVEPRNGATLYVVVGNWLFLALASAMVAGGWMAGRRVPA